MNCTKAAGAPFPLGEIGLDAPRLDEVVVRMVAVGPRHAALAAALTPTTRS